MGQRDHLDAATDVSGLERPPLWETLPDIPGYQVLRELGRGGMGVVYLARQIALDRPVALKTVEVDDADLRQLLHREAQIAGRLEHPMIVPVFDVQSERSPAFFTMGYVEGEDLAKRLLRRTFRVEEAIELGIQLCDALEYAHSEGVLHLDLKPSNVLIDRRGNPKLVDFGLSAWHAEQRGQVAGTPRFMAPEQVLGERDAIGPATDVYGLGGILFACLAGRPPVLAADPQAMAAMVVSQPPPSLRAFVPDLPKSVDAILHKCLEKDPRRRYANPRELREDLCAFREGRPVSARPPSLRSTMLYQLRRHVLATSVSGSVVMLLLVIVGWGVVRHLTQAGELKRLRDAYQRVENELVAHRASMAALLSRQQRDALTIATWERLARNEKDARLAAGYAAEAVRAGVAAGRTESADIRRMLLQYARAQGMTDVEETPDAIVDLEKVAQRVLEAMPDFRSPISQSDDLPMRSHDAPDQGDQR